MSSYLKYLIVGQFPYYFTFVSGTLIIDLYIKMLFRAFKRKHNSSCNFVFVAEQLLDGLPLLVVSYLLFPLW